MSLLFSDPSTGLITKSARFILIGNTIHLAVSEI